MSPTQPMPQCRAVSALGYGQGCCPSVGSRSSPCVLRRASRPVPAAGADPDLAGCTQSGSSRARVLGPALRSTTLPATRHSHAGARDDQRASQACRTAPGTRAVTQFERQAQRPWRSSHRVKTASARSQPFFRVWPSYSGLLPAGPTAASPAGMASSIKAAILTIFQPNARAPLDRSAMPLQIM